MLALIRDGAVAELRDITLDAVPEHKRTLWRTLSDVKPSINDALETLIGPVVEIGATTATRTWTAQRRPLAEQQAAIKAEARRRILAVMPEWRQANITARSAELHRIQAGLMRDGDGVLITARDLTAEELTEEQAINLAWAWIKSVRAASDALEAMDPIPTTFADDQHWPVAP